MRISWKRTWEIITAIGVICLAIGFYQTRFAPGAFPFFYLIGFSILLTAVVMYDIDERIKRETEKQNIQSNTEGYYEEAVKTWKRWTMAVIIGAPIMLTLSILDFWHFINTGRSVLHPYFDIFIGLLAFGLFVTAIAARISYYLKRRN